MRLSLNIGCGNKPIASTEEERWINLEIQALPGVDVVRDIRRGLPWNDGTFSHIFCDNVLEHIPSPDNIFVINEIDRVLVVGGTAEIIVPDARRGQGWAQDMGHVSYYVPRCALYWALPPKGTPYGRLAGFTCNLVTEKIEEYGNPQTECFLKFRLRKEAQP